MIEYAHGTPVGRANGKTICYREDITFILDSLALPRHIPFGTFILLFCACKNDFESSYPLQATFKNILVDARGSKEISKTIHKLSWDALTFLKLVNSLPYKYRMGLKRIPLYQAIFNGTEPESNNLKALLNEFKTGGLDDTIFYRTGELKLETFDADLRPLADALKRFPDKESLELALRTGLPEVPQSADETPLPENVPGNLFDELEEDSRTSGLSLLARFITGALSIPMHLSSSDQSVGGISDISNRGHYDKLLLSELAQDDLVLTARLANNEALFLKREELPLNNSQEWHILLDSTLKMWGVPRVFGLAAGLAFSEGRKSHEPMNAWALGGKQSQPIDLHTKEGVINCLEILDPALNCGPQLGKLLAEQKGIKGKYIMVTADHYRDDLDFLSHFLPIKDQLDYLVVVSRTGHIELFETQGGRHKLLNQATIDLDETLFGKKKQPVKRKQHTTAVGLPAFLQADKFTMYFPVSKIRLKVNNNFVTANGEVFAITQDYRVLLWEGKDHGALEIGASIVRGECYWGADGNKRLYILVNNVTNQSIIIYWYNFSDRSWNAGPTLNIKASKAKFYKGEYYLKTDDDIVIVDPETGSMKPFVQQLRSTYYNSFSFYNSASDVNLLGQSKKIVYGGYSAINSVKNVYIEPEGAIYLDSLYLHIDKYTKGLIIIKSYNPPKNIGAIKQEIMRVDHLTNIKFTKFIWANGTEFIVDSRGLLHLKSNKSSMPEVSIILITGKATACWSADGVVAGSLYFTGNNPQNGIPMPEFYDRYIQPFINGIK